MDNQHRKIAGYRELSQEEVDLMNRIKEAGRNLLALQAEVAGRISTDDLVKTNTALATADKSADRAELKRFLDAEPHRWAAIAKTDIQTGVMALVRAVAQPAGI